MPPENGTIILSSAATLGKRVDKAVQARSACARLAKAPSWTTLPGAPLAFGSGGTGDLASFDGKVFGAAVGAAGVGLATGVSGSLLRSSFESLSSPALVSNAVSLSPVTSSPPGLGGFTLYGCAGALISSGGPLTAVSRRPSQKKVAATSSPASSTTASAASILRAEMPRGSSS